eukprot:1970210-Rhodomonas_salina.1
MPFQAPEEGVPLARIQLSQLARRPHQRWSLYSFQLQQTPVESQGLSSDHSEGVAATLAPGSGTANVSTGHRIGNAPENTGDDTHRTPLRALGIMMRGEKTEPRLQSDRGAHQTFRFSSWRCN